MRTLGECGYTRKEICNRHLREIERIEPLDRFVTNVVVYPLPWHTLLVGGGGDRSSCLWSTSQLLRPSGQQCRHSGGGGGSVQKSTADNGVHIWLQLKRWCVLCMWVLQRGHSGDGCDLASTLWLLLWFVERYIICSEFGNGATSEAGKYHFRAANVWWRCAQYFFIASCG